jgi:hypothetical protein
MRTRIANTKQVPPIHSKSHKASAGACARARFHGHMHNIIQVHAITTATAIHHARARIRMMPR